MSRLRTHTSEVILAFVVICTALTSFQQPSSAQQPAPPALLYSPSLDPGSMDRSIDPCVDFYQYACGGWKKNNPIPSDQTSWSVYGKLHEDNLKFLRTILEQAARATARDTVTREIGDFYAACMDETTVNARGVAAIRPTLDAIASLGNIRALAALLARLQIDTGSRQMVFAVGSEQDPDDSEQQIAQLDQGGLGLPDRDYYTNTDAKSVETRARYVQHVQKVLELIGDSSESAKTNADAIMKIETDLARASLTRVDRRDPYKTKHKMKRAELKALAPAFDWDRYFRELGAPKFEVVNVSAPEFFKAVNAQLGSTGVAEWRSYLRFHAANVDAPYLSSAFVQEDFDFYRGYLRGAKEMQPRWKRCGQLVDRGLGEALGQVYVRDVFGPDLKQSTVDMVKGIEAAMEQRINGLDWMSAETKRQALVKLHGIRNKIGYPEKWRDYGPVDIGKSDFLGNVRHATAFESRRDLQKIGKPVDHGEWGMSPPTVNAYYDPQMNDINFPAGVLQPPLYDAKLDAAPNYGDTGGTIGHELTHGFDDEGRQFDAKGNLADWWTAEDAQRFKDRAQCVADQYAQYVVVDDIHINSKLTLGEDVADLGGEILAFIAWKDATKGKDLKPIDGLTPEQRFFVGFAQWDCANERPEDMRVRALTDPHSPSRYRINGVVVNMPEFAAAFSCKGSQPMVKPANTICKIW